MSVARVAKEAVSNFLEDGAMTYAAAIAFYTALSFAPLLLLLVFTAGMIGPESQETIIAKFNELLGEEGAGAVSMVLANASSRPDLGTLAGVVGFATLAFSATGVFGQLQAALNAVWHVKTAPGAGVRSFLQKRVLSLGLILAIGFLLLSSMVVSAVLSALLPDSGRVWKGVNAGISLGVYFVMFSLMFKFLPDVRIAWRDVWVGAVVTAVLFAVGKGLIAVYLGHGSVGSAYGAAGSLVALLVWVYYSSIILLFGAEATQAYAHVYGSAVEPQPGAVWVDGPGGRHGAAG